MGITGIWIRRWWAAGLVFTVLLGLGGCVSVGSDRGAADVRQIKERIASIREAILRKNAAGIVHYGTPDWSFTGPEGQRFDRASYLVRAEALFARVVQIESLQTAVDRVTILGDRAAVEITQRMVRREREAASGAEVRLALTYREAHVWVRGGDGWRVQRVAFLGVPERKVLPLVPAP